MPNHIGTHIDCPYHFIDSGKTLSDYSAAFWMDRPAILIDVHCEPNQIILAKDIQVELLKLDRKIRSEVSTVLVRTGFEKFRFDRKYWEQNPGFSPEVALFLKSEFPNIGILGMDSISLTGFQSRELGREAHRAFLGSGDGDPILLLEDMRLSVITSSFLQVTVLPLLIQGADGAPCTVVGRWTD